MPNALVPAFAVSTPCQFPVMFPVADAGAVGVELEEEDAAVGPTPHPTNPGMSVDTVKAKANFRAYVLQINMGWTSLDFL